MYWANFLHIYQPPTQSPEIVKKVAAESYRVLVRTLEDAPGAKITLNINGVLTEQLARSGCVDVLNGLKRLALRGQIEFTGSAMYHPILPLIPAAEMVRQIELNSEVNRRYFGEAYRPRGFFPPEMCYSLEVARVVSQLGFRWIIVDEIALQGKVGTSIRDALYEIEALPGMLVFFKERTISAGITYGTFPNSAPFLQALPGPSSAPSYLLSGTDGEVYGHHRPGQEKLLHEIFHLGRPATCTISELERLFVKRERVAPRPSSWSTWEDEMAQGIPYPQWQYPGHELHRLQWRLADLALELVRSIPADSPERQAAHRLLDQGLHSDQFWWASCRPWWDTGMVKAGARQLSDAVRGLSRDLPPPKIQEAADLFEAIAATADRWQASGEAQNRKQAYLDAHRQVTTELTFGKA